MTRRIAAVTGATGFLGREIVRALALQGWTVRVLARRDPVDPLWRDLTPHVVPGDLFDEGALRALCAGAEVVIHAAGLTKGHARTLHLVNVEGTRRVAQAAQAAASRPDALLVSSLAAREPQLSPYAASKRAAEAAMGESLGERLTIVRPPAIYGPGDRELLPVFRAAAASPVLPVLNDRARIALVHVRDAATQIAALAEREACGGLFPLCDGVAAGYGWRAIMSAAAAACGARPSLVPIPAAVVRMVGRINDLRAALGPAPMLTSGKARELLHADWSIPPGELAPGLPQPRYDLASGFADVVAWCRDERLLR